MSINNSRISPILSFKDYIRIEELTGCCFFLALKRALNEP
jgi:hypothetical protein